jgi:tetratricopeptide (TPR) repeat protein
MNQARGRARLVLRLFLLTCLAGFAMPALPALAMEDEIAPGMDAGRPDGGDAESMAPAQSGRDLTGPAPSSTPNKQDRSDVLGNVPLADPAIREAILKQLYAQLRSARDAAAAKPISEAIEETWRHSGSDTVDLLMSRVDTFVLDADLDLALKVLDAVTDLAPEDTEAWHQRGLVHLMKSDTDQALEDLRRAVAMEPNNYNALRDLGAALLQTGDKKGALESYRKALAVNPFLEQAKRAAEDLAHELEGQDI